MCTKSHIIIHRNLDFLMKDLGDDVLHYCGKILNQEEMKLVYEKEKESDKVALYLDFLARKPYEDISSFIRYLEEWYSWLHIKLMNTLNEVKEEDPLFKVHALGGIPNLPPKNVTRTRLLNEVEEQLKKLKKGHYLVLHGMIGSGKKSLAVQSLRNYNIIRLFKDQVYWLTVGSEGAKDPSFLLNELNSRLPKPLPIIPDNNRLATIELTKWFVHNGWTDSLIVLDNVTDESVLDAFNIGAKFLVTTVDQTIISDRRAAVTTHIKVSEGFTPQETMQLFTEALPKLKEVKEPTISYSSYITEIHKQTKGHPFLLNLIVSQFTENFQEGLLTDHGRWDYIIKNVLHKDNKRRSLSDVELFKKPIQSSIDSLERIDQERFYKLAVFLEDVNIKPEVLATLWSVNKYFAEEIMVKFVHKSLAVRKWNEPQGSYVYGVHDLIAGFLRKDLSPEKEQDLHKSFINEYQKLSNNVWSNLPSDDNYIFYYIGYHLKKAGMNEVFSDIYFDMEFLQAKLRAASPADLIQDFKQYQELITNKDDHMVERLNQYSDFIKNLGVWICRGVDIVQAALQCHNEFIKGIGNSLAHRRSYDQYYVLCSSSKKKKVPDSLAVRESSRIVTLCFGKTLDEILIAFENNIIQLYNFKTKNIIMQCKRHTGKITCLNVSPSKPEFLSSSFDNTVIVWSLPSSDSSSGDRTPSPRDRQVDYQDFYNVSELGDSPQVVLNHTHPVLFALFSRQGEMIGTLSLNGTVMVWKDKKILWETSDYHIKSIDFVREDKVLVAADFAQIVFFNSASGDLLKKVDHTYEDSFISLRSLPIGELGERVVVITKKGIMMMMMDEANSDLQSMDFPDLRSPISKFCSVGLYIAVTTDDNSLYVLNPENGAIAVHLTPQKKVVSFCVGENAILAGDHDGKVLQYLIESLSSPFTQVKWSAGSGPVYASVNNRHALLNVSIGEKTTSIDVKDVDKMDVSEDGETVVTCSKSGEVFFHCLGDFSGYRVDHRPTSPCRLFLLKDIHEYIVVLSYAETGTWIWRSKQRKLEPWISGSAVDYVDLIHFGKRRMLITAPFFTTRYLDEVNKNPQSMELDGPYCFNRLKKSLAVITPSGLKIYLITEDGGHVEQPIRDTSRHVQQLAFSPSGSKLALFDVEGTCKVLDYQDMSWRYLPANKVSKKASCLAVSDQGTVCYGGDNLLSIITRDGISSTAILDPAHISADPNKEDMFAVTDRTGLMYMVNQRIIKGGSQAD